MSAESPSYSIDMIFCAGVNCTQSDLDAITASRDDVEILDYNSELYYEKYYEYVKDIKKKK